MLSPYPLPATLRLPFDYLSPSTTGRGDLSCAPLAAELTPSDSSPSVTITLFGDLMRARGGRVPKIDSALRAVLGRSDLVVGNCEGPVTRGPWSRRQLIRERVSPGFVGDLLGEMGVRTGTCVLSVANNHSGDRDCGGLDETVGRLAELGIPAAGLALAPTVRVCAGGLAIGVVAWTDLMNHDVFAPGAGVARSPQVAARNWEEVRRQARLDCLIGLPHWDLEFRPFPSRATRSAARRLLDQGFEVVAGHHPHVLQPIELGERGLVAYSLGNVSGPTLPVPWPARLGALLEVRLGVGGEVRGRVLSYRLHPFVQAPGRPFALVPAEVAPASLRSRASDRLRRLFPAPAEHSPPLMRRDAETLDYDL